MAWDNQTGEISLISGQAYTWVGRELSTGDGLNKISAPSGNRLSIDGKEAECAAYNIDNNNYFKLRDLAEIIDCKVEWDASANAVFIDTSQQYDNLNKQYSRNSV